METMIPKMLAGGFGVATYIVLLLMLSPKNRKRFVDITVIAIVGYVIYSNTVNREPAARASAFAEAVNMEPFLSVAVQTGGRIKSFDSHARTMMRYISGSKRIAGQQPALTYLDMMFRPAAYLNADIVYVKKKQIRQTIADHLARVNDVDMSVLEVFRDTGLLSPTLLRHPVVTRLLDELERDLMRTAKPVNQIRTAMSVLRPETLSGELRIIPPPGGSAADGWHLGEALWGGAPMDDAHSGVRAAAGVPGLESELAAQLKQTWSKLSMSWRAQDAVAVNDALSRTASLLRTVAPSIYPPLDKLRLGNWYFRWKSMTWIWIVYTAAVVPLLMSVIYRWRGARLAGIGLFVLAFALHTVSLGLRWRISGRIPNSNMFESITAATWFGGVVAFVLEYITRSTPMRNMFFLGAACAAMVATMFGNFLPETLSSDIENIMPVLHDVWLYIHTNMIIMSYALIGMAAVTALLYLRHRLGGGSPDYAGLGGAGSLIMRSKTGGGFLTGARTTSSQVLDGATMVMMELSFIMLWTGLVMGAIWADHSWGRPWGWDPKEVFALNTFIVFLLLVHVRFKVRDKGLWTAVLATVGCCVMLFNWIVINFVITGLHSYA